MISSARTPRIVASQSYPRFTLFVAIFISVDTNNYNLILAAKTNITFRYAEYPIKRINDDLNLRDLHRSAHRLNIFNSPGFPDALLLR